MHAPVVDRKERRDDAQNKPASNARNKEKLNDQVVYKGNDIDNDRTAAQVAS